MKQLKLSTKIIAGFALVILMMGAAVGIYQFTVKRTTSGFSGLLKGDVAVLMHAGKVRAAMLQARRDEMDFLLNKDLKYLDLHQKNIEELKTQASAIRQIVQQTGNQQMAAEAATIITLADTYRKQFIVLAEAQKKAGLDPESGYQGIFQKAAQELQETMPEYDVDNLHTSLLTLRRYEKDYYRVKSDANEKKFTHAVQTFEALLADSPCDAVAKKRMQDALGAYKQAKNRFIVSNKNLEKAMQYHKMRKMATEMETAINTVKVPGAMAMMGDIRRHEKDFLLGKDKKYLAKVHQATDRLYNAFVQAGVLKKHVDKIKSELDTYTKSFDALVGEYNEIDKAMDAMHEAVHQIEPLVDQIYKKSTQETNTQSLDISQKANSLASTAIFIALSIMLVAMLIAFALTRSINKPIHSIIKDLTGGAEQVADASAQVSSSSQALSEGTSKQAAALEETSSTMEEISSMTTQNSDNASLAENLMNTALETIEGAVLAMKNIGESMGEISTASEETSKIIKTIDEIAFKTNLLALNAAVEAARAGEAGAGFAVVADEVRNLAMRAAEAAENTSVLIEDTVIKVNKGKDVVAEANQSFASVTEASSKIGGLVSEIATASREQARGFARINDAITQMDGLTTQNSSTAEESAAASEELNAQASNMMAVVNTLMGMVEGGSVVRHPDTTSSGKISQAKMLSEDENNQFITGSSSKAF